MAKNSSWNKVSGWYQKLVRGKGDYYHEHVVIPQTLRLLGIKTSDMVLDLGCGEGILSRFLNPQVEYLGIDLSPNLIESAKKTSRGAKHQFLVADITKQLQLKQNNFSVAALILSLQNMDSPEIVLKNAVSHLVEGGKLLLVLNHPCFRIPRQSGWGIDEQNKLQYRKIFRYSSFLKIPINIHPGIKSSPLIWSFHYSLGRLSKALKDAGFYIDLMEEWSSDKESSGKASKMENRARSEIPLFLAILAVKK